MIDFLLSLYLAHRYRVYVQRCPVDFPFGTFSYYELTGVCKLTSVSHFQILIKAIVGYNLSKPPIPSLDTLVHFNPSCSLHQYGMARRQVLQQLAMKMATIFESLPPPDSHDVATEAKLVYKTIACMRWTSFGFWIEPKTLQDIVVSLISRATSLANYTRLPVDFPLSMYLEWLHVRNTGLLYEEVRAHN